MPAGSTDALSRSPHGAAPPEGVAKSEVQVASLQSDPDPEPDARQQADGEISDLLTEPPRLAETEDFGAEQREDPNVKEINDFIKQGTLPSDNKTARRIAMQKSMFAVENGMLFYLDPRQKYRKRAAVPKCLRGQLLLEHHSSRMGGHFAVKKTYGAALMACTATPKGSWPTVHSVPLLLVGGDIPVHPCTPYLSTAHFRYLA